VAIPLDLRLDAVGVSLRELVSQRTGVVSPFLIHHVQPYGNAPTGSRVFVDAMSKAFTKARQLAGIPDEGAPTLHEVRSLAKRLYGGAVGDELFGWSKGSAMPAKYSDPRGAEPVRVRVG
jgi:hypothetical protein